MRQTAIYEKPVAIDELQRCSRFSLILIVLLFFLQGARPAQAQIDPGKPRGQLIMIGGGLGGSNKPVFQDLIESAGGRDKARFALLPTANLSIESARHFQKDLEAFGVSREQISVLEVLHTNAALAAKDPANVNIIDRATAVYMTGGDQVRLVQSLINPDGSDTPLLAAMRRLYQRGGLIAGSSAGASAQSAHMLAVSGLPSMLVDEGLDALDYGLTTDLQSRGILVTKGLGFLEQGIVDQHFLQYRGRLGRLSRVALERDLAYGIGVDKDSAVRVDRNGKIIVTGGRAVIVMPAKASFCSGALGFSMDNVQLSLLSTGDVFDPADSSVSIHSTKQEIVGENVAFNGGFLIPDIGSGYAVGSALIGGLAENFQSSQEGIVLKFHGNTSHGYRYLFQKVQTTKAYRAESPDGSLYSLVNVQLGISPIANGLYPSSSQTPIDIEDLPVATRYAIQAVAFRGIVPTNSRLEFQPDQLVTRRDFAVACVRSVHLNAPTMNRKVNDIAGGQQLGLEQALEAGFVMADGRNQLCPDSPISNHDLKIGLRRLAKLSAVTAPAAFQLALDELKDSDASSVTRSKLAVLLTQLLNPNWFCPQ